MEVKGLSELYERIRILRKDNLKLSQEKFAAMICVSRDVVKNMN
jgi:DNA-binding transcriptional regulator YiaG